MNIPEEAVEAAARKIFEYDAPSHHPDEWGPLNGWAKSDYHATARATLEAAAPLLMAQAWDEGNYAGCDRSENHANPYRPQQHRQVLRSHEVEHHPDSPGYPIQEPDAAERAARHIGGMNP